MFIVPQVYSRLQKLNLVMSHQVTIRLVTKLGMEHDGKVKEWRDVLTSSLQTADTEVKSYIIIYIYNIALTVHAHTVHAFTVSMLHIYAG